MTVAELKHGVALLGFEESLPALDDTAEQHFWYAVNRALWTVNRLRPKKGVYELCHFSPKNLLPYENRQHKGGVSLEFSVFGAKAYTFSVVGTGNCVIQNGEKTISLSWEGAQGRRFSGFLSGGEVSVSFRGDYDYSILSLALWDSIISGEIKDIPEGKSSVTYDLAMLVPDFLRLDEKPFWDRVPDGIKILSPSHVALGRETEGCVSLCYRKKWDSITENTPEDTPLPLDEDLCQLLPQLIASELCLDADEEKATYYRQLYQEQAGEVATEYTPHTPSTYLSHNNW